MPTFQWKSDEIFEKISEWLEKNQEKPFDKYVVHIKKKSKQRTLPQNSLFHVLFEIIKQEEEKLWNLFTRDEIKEMMKKALLWVKIIWIWKFQTEVPLKWTSDLTEQEWIIFIEKILYFLEKHYWIKIESLEDKRLLEFYDQYIFWKEK